MLMSWYNVSMKSIYAVIGNPITGSRSPEIYAPMFKRFDMDTKFLRLRVTTRQIPNIRNIAAKHQLSGFAVTMPHKRSIIPYLDAITPDAEECGAVNIVTIDPKGRLIGHNTDGVGLTNAMREARMRFLNRSFVILGSGGAASSATCALMRLGGKVNIIVRDETTVPEHLRRFIPKSFSEYYIKNTNDIADRLYELDVHTHMLRNSVAIINATPLGMSDEQDFSNFRFLEGLRLSCFIIDLTYREGGTSLIKRADEIGFRVIDGTKVLYHQAVPAFKLWTGYDYR